MNDTQSGISEPDEPCLAPNCERWTSEHTAEQSRECGIAYLEQRIAEMDRSYDQERAELQEGGAYLGQGELDGSDHDRLKDMEFERSMELQGLRLDLEELRSAGQPTPELEAEAER